MSVAVGETHGNDAPDDSPTPKGLNVVGRHVGAVREPSLRLIGRDGRIRPLRGRREICWWVRSVGFTHGNHVPKGSPTPKGLNVVGRHVGAVREPSLRLIGGRRVQPLRGRGIHWWKGPVRGFHPRLVRLKAPLTGEVEVLSEST